MTKRYKRYSGVYRSDPCYLPFLNIEGTIRNVFPHIHTDELKKGVQRSYYIPTIRGVFVPPGADRLDFKARVWHEHTHLQVSDVVATCEEQFLIYFFLGVMMEYLAVPGSRILIPSFTVMFPDGETNDLLTNLANQIDELYFTTGLIHEIVANVAQAEVEDSHREKVKQSIMESIDEICIKPEDKEFVNEHLTGQMLDIIIDVCKEVSIYGTWLLARYALNTPHVYRELALLRFLKAVQLVRGFRCVPSPWKGFLAFTEYLNQNLPDYNEGRCPLEGNCLASKLESVAQLTFSGEPSVVMLDGVGIMKHLGCEQKRSFVIPEITGNIGISNIGLDLLRLILRRSVTEVLGVDGWSDEQMLKSVRSVGAEFGIDDLEIFIMPRIFLTLVKNKTNRYHVTLAPNSFNKTVASFKAANVNIADVFLYEALWEQLSQEEGPLCFCEDIWEDCPYRPVLAKIWKQSEPDMDWEQNWKQSEPPECIRNLL